MLLNKLIHPEILGALGRMGHGSRIVIGDGCYPHITGSPATATRVYLNLAPDQLLVTDVLEALAATIPIEEAYVMAPPDMTDQPVYDEFRKRLPKGVDVEKVMQFDFYKKAREPDVALMIATGDQRNYANLMLKMGFVKHAEGKGDY